MRWIRDFVEDWKKKSEAEKKLNKEINAEVKEIRIKGRKERIIAVEKKRQQYKKEDAIDALDSGGAGGGGFKEMFGKFQDFATDFAKNQNKNRRY